MEQKRTAPRAQKTQPLTYREWKRRKQLRLARNWVLFLAGCALVVFLLTKGILWLLPHLHGADGPQTFAASAYDSTGYFFDADDARLVLVNANLPFDEEPSPTLDAADEAGTQLEAEAAQQYRSMAEAAQADGITLTLTAGYQDADTRTAAYEAQKQTYLARHKSEEEASARAAAILPEAKRQRARHRLCGRHPQHGLHRPGHRLCRYPRLPVAHGLRRRVRLYPALPGGPAGHHRGGVRAVALAVCGGGKRPGHPCQRPEPGGIPGRTEGPVTFANKTFRALARGTEN